MPCTPCIPISGSVLLVQFVGSSGRARGVGSAEPRCEPAAQINDRDPYFGRGTESGLQVCGFFWLRGCYVESVRANKSIESNRFRYWPWLFGVARRRQVVTDKNIRICL